MDIDDFHYKDFLPYYLTEDQRVGLASALKDFSSKSNIYTQMYQEEVLQGDCWDGVPFIDFSGRKEQIKAIFLSNSCDIDQANVRHAPVYITYAPLIGLAAYEAMLLAKFDAKVVAEKVDAIKAQKITSLIYLPASVEGTVESLAVLDKAMSMPYKLFEAQVGRRKITSLNQLGFYLFSFKLSIHFCRMHEGLARG